MSVDSGPEVFVVRHGATEWSESGRHTSVTDLPLTGGGRRAARAAGRWLRIRLGDTEPRVLTSPRLRARDTCSLAGFGPAAVVDPDLAEWDYGRYEGLTTPEIRRSDPGWTIFGRGAPGGESVDDVQARADRVLARLRASDGPVVVFSHGHVSRVLAVRWVGLDAGWGRALELDAGAVSVLGHERDTPTLARWNVRP